MYGYLNVKLALKIKFSNETQKILSASPTFPEPAFALVCVQPLSFARLKQSEWLCGEWVGGNGGCSGCDDVGVVVWAVGVGARRVPLLLFLQNCCAHSSLSAMLLLSSPLPLTRNVSGGEVTAGTTSALPLTRICKVKLAWRS